MINDAVHTVSNIMNFKVGILTCFTLSECSFIEYLMKRYDLNQQEVIRICVNRAIRDYTENPELFNCDAN